MTTALFVLAVTCIVAAALITALPNAGFIAAAFIIVGCIVGWGAVRQHRDP